MIDPNHVELIASILPEPIKSTQSHHGDDFIVIEVNQTWMFRFPRSPEPLSVLEIEKKFLSEFRSLSPITVPEYIYIGAGFVGYRKIEGLLLSPARFTALPEINQKKVCKQIGAFLSVIHSFPMDRARQMGMTEGWNGFRKKAFQTFKTEIAPRLSYKALQNSIACLEAYFSNQYSLVVVHGDFLPREHLFLDPQRQELCGIIDFGDLTLEDPVCDLKNILSDFGEETLQQVLSAYTCSPDEKIIDRMKLAIKVEPLFDAAYDVQLGYPGRLTHHIRNIEKIFGR